MIDCKMKYSEFVSRYSGQRLNSLVVFGDPRQRHFGVLGFLKGATRS